MCNLLKIFIGIDVVIKKIKAHKICFFKPLNNTWGMWFHKLIMVLAQLAADSLAQPICTAFRLYLIDTLVQTEFQI